jgi:hypothetical protein
MRNYEAALGRDPPPGLEFLSKDLQKKWFSTNLIGNMENTVDRLYGGDSVQRSVEKILAVELAGT